MFSRAADFRAGARAVLRGNWLTPILICFVGGLLGGLESGSGYSPSANTSQSVSFETIYTSLMPIIIVFAIWGLVVFFIGGAIRLGVCAYFSRLNLGERPPFSSLFDRMGYLWKALGLRLFTALFIFLWSIILVVPGIIAWYRYSMAVYIMAEHPETGIREAVNLSKEMMKGNKERLFCLRFSFIGWAFLALAPVFIGVIYYSLSVTPLMSLDVYSFNARFIVLAVLAFSVLSAGFLWLTPYMEASSAAFYLELTGRSYGITPDRRSEFEDE